MKLKIINLLLFFFLAFNFYGQIEVGKGKREGFKFTDIINIENTSVKSQGASGTCWSYSTNSFLESEAIKAGKEPIDLAEMFIVRTTYTEKADRYVRMHGTLTFSQGGELPDVIDMYRLYGAVPQEVYPGLNYGTEINRHGEMSTMLKAMLDAVIENKNKKLTPVWKKAIEAVLDVYLGDYPSEFMYKGKKYTPRTFADEYVGINPDDYIGFTSWTHKPFYKKMILMIPDNWNYGEYFNVPMNDMVKIVDNALKNGYTISWATDVSEKYFSWKNGVAYVPEKEYNKMTKEEKNDMFSGPKPEMKITQELRQKGYDNYTTTDDHGMHIVGLAKDQNGTEYYIVKNSWDTKNIYNGYLYMSKEFFKYKTVGFLINKNGIPKNLKKKLGL